jgi:16S rRNA processing protein RimM
VATTPKRDELPDWSELVAIGSIARSQGREGEVAVNPLTDFPERFAGLSRVFLEGESGEPVAYALESARLHKGRPVVKLAGVSSIGEARLLAGKEIRIPASELVSLPDGSFYHFQISGLDVIDRRHGRLGIAEEILSTGGTDIIVVRSPDGSELLLPFCSEICRRVDLDGGYVEVEAPEGLIDLNAH